MTSLLPSIKNGAPRKPISFQISASEEVMLSAMDSVLYQLEVFSIANVMLSNASIRIGEKTYATIAVTLEINLGAG